MASKGGADISVVVPVFNAGDRLNVVVDRIESALAQTQRAFEILLVDDGSSDQGWERIKSLASSRSRVRGISLFRNYGQHNALLEGVREARGSLIVTLDDDLQYPPEEISKLIAKIDEGFDVVYGTPVKKQQPWSRSLGSWLVRYSLRLVLRTRVARHASAFRAFRTELREVFRDYSGPYVSIDVLLSWGTTKFGAVGVRHDQGGTSRYGFRSLVAVALNMLTGFSIIPLRLASLIGVVFAFLGLCVLAFVLVTFFIERGSVPGFPFLASIVAVFSGVQLLVMGVIGEYLARVHFRSMGMPFAAVRERAGFESSEL